MIIKKPDNHRAFFMGNIMAQYRNLTIEQGTTWHEIIYATDNFGRPLDLTDFSVVMKMKKSYESKIAYPFTAVITDAIKGEITTSMTAEQTTELKATRYLYECVISNPTTTADQPIPVVIRLLEGIVSVSPSIM